MATKKMALARRLMSNKEKKSRQKGGLLSPFFSNNWYQRTEGIKARVKRKQDAAHARAVARKLALIK